jgi:LysR family transcriptional regulator, regulator for bpeEF and oprC
MTKKFDLNAMLLFYEIVNAEGINRAAAKLKLPKSTLSRKLATLERQVGALLVKRGTRKLTTTEIGQNFYEHCGRIIEEMNTASSQAFEMQTQVRGTLRVSMPIDFGVSGLSRLISGFVQKYPDVSLALDANNRWVDVTEEPYDVAIHVGNSTKNSQLPARPVAVLNRGLYASPEYLARRGVPRRMEDLQDHDCIVHGGQTQEGVWSYRDSSGNRMDIAGRVTVNNIGVARELVIGGCGIGVLPNLMCQRDVEASRLRRVLRERSIPRLSATATFVSRGQTPRRTRLFLDFLAERLVAEEQDSARSPKGSKAE